MTAREKFKIGDRVRMNALGLKRRAASGHGRCPTTGRVTGYAHVDHPHGVAVLRDGRKTAIVVHADWWDVDDATAKALLDLQRAALTYADTIQNDDVTEFTGESLLNAALAFARSLSKADRERLGR